MVRNDNEQTKHDKVVCGVGKGFVRLGYKVAVAGKCDVEEELELPCFTDEMLGCEDAQCRIPDVFATKEGENDKEKEKDKG